MTSSHWTSIALPVRSRSRAKLLLPPETPRARGQHAVDVLRELLLTDPAYPWESVLAESLKGLGRRYRSAEDTQRLLDAWNIAVPLPELADEFDVDEPQLIRHLRSLVQAITGTAELVPVEQLAAS